MKKQLLALAAASGAAGAVHAGEIQRAADPSQILFAEGRNFVEASVATVHPSISGVAGVSSGNMTESYQNFSLGYKHQYNDRLTFAIIAHEPVGADVNYAAGTPYPFSGSNAEVDSLAITGLVKYNFTDRFSAYGGLRVQSLSGNVNITFPVAYTLTVDKDYKLGYVLGAAYQIPDIAMKVALTYESKIEHDFRDNTGAEFNVEIPQAVTLHAQSGIAKDTLLFGSVRWQEWTKFMIAPGDFLGGAVPIASGPSDITTYEIGVGRRFTDNWSGALTLGYEEDKGDIVGNLSGKDGFISYGVAAKYETEDWEFTAGIKYFDIGNATTTIGANFADNDAVAVGFKVGHRF